MKIDTNAEIVGKYILDHLNKLISGEHKGHAVICPLRGPSGGIVRIQIDMPTMVDFVWNKDGGRKALSYTWIPDDNGYVLNDYVFKVKP